ncbi:uncharacterized protein LOC125075258 [Vanessa atalanta]|uniref:uncharacterized protein LOC125075258 n=1 Tax=Vanessa atalanta TaxID=42275 RepID=UPI001FCD4C2D|nr:uncharacterized protein LOC125075258 [Vanessa atalanta]
MSLWQFSESSLPLLKRCIEASKLDLNNKWIKRFGSYNHLDMKNVVNENDNKAIPIPSPENTNTDNKETLIQDKDEISDDIWREIIDIDPISQFDYLVENCLKHSALYTMLAEKLSLTSVEKLCNHIFETNVLNLTFLQKFYTSFLPVYLKREYTRTSLDIIIKAEKYNSDIFKYLLELIIKDTELPGQVIQQYISTIDTKSQLELMKNIILFNLSNEVFMHHLYSIHILYKNCEKTDYIQQFILTKLSNVSQHCVNDKNYGRLLLTYLQAQKKFNKNYTVIQKIIDLHRSPFKKPCMNAFNELQKLHDDSVLNSNENY